LDFTHTRIVIAALLPLCGLIALFIGHWHKEGRMESCRGYQGPLILGLAFAAAVIVSLGIEALGDHVGGPFDFELTDSWMDFGRQLRLLIASAWAGTPFVVPPPVGHFSAWMKASVVAQVVGYAMLAAFGAAISARMPPRRTPLSAFLVLFCGNLLVIDAFQYADFQVNGEHVRTARPFAESNSYMPLTNEFIPPSASETAELHRRLESESYRTILLARNSPELPLIISPHIGAFWNLRLVEGYSSGVPLRLGMLPWSTEVLGLRSMTFAKINETKLPWRLLAFLNVKYGIYVNLPFYKNTLSDLPSGESMGPMGTKIVENPFRPAPREFFPRKVTSVSTLPLALREIFPGQSMDPAIDPVKISVVESAERLSLSNNNEGDVRTIYRGDEISLSVNPSQKVRLLVLNELYHPDWHAYLGAIPLLVYPANVVMRGILIPAGASQITLRFEPYCSFGRLGLACGAATAAAVLFALLCGRFGPDSWFKSCAD
jgi:hypothetical protein